ncbi:hypothetical protein CDD80_5628 [Ophiocordyceps camponoti-rufipedis]|uniref:Uncharacterized protein n=1 Tax=Ophiocordyceps camponoti-rufipedis TaxID=2004952 RepID=A0A2C5YQB9_9HYPO|nr:hypothetical protein CDD80_5628 [Ophiocordyceps camponoti-rufipedis]
MCHTHGQGIRPCSCFSPRPRGSRTQQKCNINLAKYSPLFRTIAVEAEHNRYCFSTMKAMVRALRVFAHSPESKLNLSTLYISVAPSPVDDDDDVGDDGAYDDGNAPKKDIPPYTFVNFFTSSSPVLFAIRDINCRFLKVIVSGSHLTGPKAIKERRLTLDRRIEMIINNAGTDDMWDNDDVVFHVREMKYLGTHKRLFQMGDHVLKLINEMTGEAKKDAPTEA